MNIMRRFSIIIITVLVSVMAFPQSPQKISYQAVIRNSNNTLVVNTTIGVKINLHQDSPTGTIVYTETQTPTTNANGLISIEIGGGVGFGSINWASGIYFIETQIAVVAPLTTYTISTTSQFLSVPFALYANTAGGVNSGGRTNEHYAGELYGGGVVFWVDHSGEHGLIVSMIDLSTNQIWSNVTNALIGTTNDWDGASNTLAIIGQAGHTSSAAKLCADYTNIDYGTGVYSDWYLPSIAELNHIWNNFYEVQKILYTDGNASTTPLARAFYWSSSEGYNFNAWHFSFDYGSTYGANEYDSYYVRAVRAF